MRSICSLSSLFCLPVSILVMQMKSTFCCIVPILAICWQLCRFSVTWVFIFAYKTRCMCLVIRTRKFSSRLRCGVSVKYFSFRSMSVISTFGSGRQTASDYLMVTSSMWSTQHPERGWHFCCPKGHAKWAMYQWGSIYASLGQLVTNRCNSHAT